MTHEGREEISDRAKKYRSSPNPSSLALNSFPERPPHHTYSHSTTGAFKMRFFPQFLKSQKSCFSVDAPFLGPSLWTSVATPGSGGLSKKEFHYGMIAAEIIGGEPPLEVVRGGSISRRNRALNREIAEIIAEKTHSEHT